MSVRRLLLLVLLVGSLLALARAHSGAMARRAAARYGGRCDGRGLWHNDISRKAGRWVWLGQNVGCGTLGRDGVKASVRRIQNAFMSSPGHRRNILHRGPPASGPAPGSPGRSSGSRSTSSSPPADPAGRYPLTGRR
jgi:hypothetical protein